MTRQGTKWWSPLQDSSDRYKSRVLTSSELNWRMSPVGHFRKTLQVDWERMCCWSEITCQSRKWHRWSWHKLDTRCETRLLHRSQSPNLKGARYEELDYLASQSQVWLALHFFYLSLSNFFLTSDLILYSSTCPTWEWFSHSCFPFLGSVVQFQSTANMKTQCIFIAKMLDIYLYYIYAVLHYLNIVLYFSIFYFSILGSLLITLMVVKF